MSGNDRSVATYVVVSVVFGLVLILVIAASVHWFGWWQAVVITLVVSVLWGVLAGKLWLSARDGG